MKTKTYNKRRGARISLPTLALGLFSLMAVSCSDALSDTVTSDGDACPKEVLKEAQNIFEARITRVGDRYYSVRVVCGVDATKAMEEYMKMSMGAEFDLDVVEEMPLLITKMQLIEMKNLSTKVTAEMITEADRLNGISWKGVVDVGAQVERRRVLDLMPTLEKVISTEGAVEIPWTEKKLKWMARPGEMLSTFDTLMAAGLAANPEIGNPEEDIPALRVFSEMVDEAIVEGFRGGEWSDWAERPGNSYQYTRVTVRDGVVEAETNESAKDSVDGDLFYFRAPDKSKQGIGGFGRMIEAMSRDEGQTTAFLLKPDMEALREAGIVE